jgi:hypothetical protein
MTKNLSSVLLNDHLGDTKYVAPFLTSVEVLLDPLIASDLKSKRIAMAIM